MKSVHRFIKTFLGFGIKVHILFFVIVALLVWGVNLYFHPDYFNSQDAAIYADIARNAVKGEGFLSRTALPLHFTYYDPSGRNLWPSAYPLLHPLMVAISFFIFGISDFSVILVNLFFFLATVPIVYLLAKKLFNKEVAVFSCLWYIFNPDLLSYSIGGMSEPLFIFETVLVFYLLTFDKFWAFLASGILVGLGLLTRFQASLYILPILGFILKKNKKLANILVFLVGIGMVKVFSKLIFPALAQDYTGFSNLHLWAAVANGSIFPNYDVGQSVRPVIFDLLFSNFSLVLQKIFFNLWQFIGGVIFFTAPIVAVLYFLSLFRSFTKTALWMKRFLIVNIALLLLFHIVTIFNFRYIHPLLPIIIIFAVEMLIFILSTVSKKNYLALAFLFTFVFVLPLWVINNATGTGILRVISQKSGRPTIHQIVAKIAKENVPVDAILASDESEHIAWYGQRKTIGLPKTKEDLIYLDKNKLAIDAIFITNHPVKNSLGEEWDELVNNPSDFGNFYFAREFKVSGSENYYGRDLKAVLFLKKK